MRAFSYRRRRRTWRGSFCCWSLPEQGRCLSRRSPTLEDAALGVEVFAAGPCQSREGASQGVLLPSKTVYLAWKFLHGTCRRRERDFDSALTFFLHFTDAGKETFAVLSPHYMAYADVRKEAALGLLSPEARYERAGVRDVATLPLPLTDSDMFSSPYHTKLD